MQVTITGGAGHAPATLDYTAQDLAYIQATALASIINNTYQHAIYYNPNHPPLVPSPGYLIVAAKYADNVIDATGFGAVVVENNQQFTTIRGGGADASGGQTVLAGDGGLNYSATNGKNTVVAGGGANYVSFIGDDRKVAAYTSTGNDTIYGGDGHTTISAGTGDNHIFLYDGHSLVRSAGNDTIYLKGSGSDTINVRGSGQDLVRAGQSDPGFKLTFVGGAEASTVLGGAGSYTIFGGDGGGEFHGGAGGDNSITANAGAATIIGGGAGDTLMGGSGSDNIKAGLGNETLGGGTGHNLFDLTMHGTIGSSGNGTTDTITDFSRQDLLMVGGTLATNYALNTYHVIDGNGTFYLEDGTQVVLTGHTHPLSINDFKH